MQALFFASAALAAAAHKHRQKHVTGNTWQRGGRVSNGLATTQEWARSKMQHV